MEMDEVHNLIACELPRTLEVLDIPSIKPTRKWVFGDISNNLPSLPRATWTIAFPPRLTTVSLDIATNAVMLRSLEEYLNGEASAHLRSLTVLNAPFYSDAFDPVVKGLHHHAPTLHELHLQGSWDDRDRFSRRETDEGRSTPQPPLFRRVLERLTACHTLVVDEKMLERPHRVLDVVLPLAKAQLRELSVYAGAAKQYDGSSGGETTLTQDAACDFLGALAARRLAGGADAPGLRTLRILHGSSMHEVDAWMLRAVAASAGVDVHGEWERGANKPWTAYETEGPPSWGRRAKDAARNEFDDFWSDDYED
ncbi:hypothetical protein JCM10450v2_002689 [Rhodotorula kratochvilovae]